MPWEGLNNRRSWKFEEFEGNTKTADNFIQRRLDM